MNSVLLQLSLGVGFLLPHVISIINQAHWNPGVKSLVAFASCVVAAVIITWSKNQLDFHHLVESAGIVYALARSSYSGLWKPLGVSDAVESSTTLRTPGP